MHFLKRPANRFLDKEGDTSEMLVCFTNAVHEMVVGKLKVEGTLNVWLEMCFSKCQDVELNLFDSLTAS